MYLDFHKYNYSIVPEPQREQYIDRDKKSYEEVIERWMKDNMSSFVDRKWEIEEIGYFKDISDFINLLREAESLYELGFFTSCIALVGVSSEDFTKYLAIKLGKPEYENEKQFNRLKKLLSDNLITQDIYDLLDEIRKVRNDCLHYNDNFKQKGQEDLKADSLIVLNNLKNVIKICIGINGEIDKDGFMEIIHKITESKEDIRNFEEIISKVKNATSHLLNFPIAFSPTEKTRIVFKYYKVLEIDLGNNEITLEDISVGIPVYVDLNAESKKNITDKGIKEGDTTFAFIYSIIDKNGLTSIWNLLGIEKK